MDDKQKYSKPSLSGGYIRKDITKYFKSEQAAYVFILTHIMNTSDDIDLGIIGITDDMYTSEAEATKWYRNMIKILGKDLIKDTLIGKTNKDYNKNEISKDEIEKTINVLNDFYARLICSCRKTTIDENTPLGQITTVSSTELIKLAKQYASQTNTELKTKTRNELIKQYLGFDIDTFNKTTNEIKEVVKSIMNMIKPENKIGGD